MDQKISATGGIVSGVILIVCGVAMIPLGIGMLSAYPDKIWIAGAVLTGCSGLILPAAIKQIRKSSSSLKTIDQDIVSLKQAAQKKEAAIIPSIRENETAIGAQPVDQITGPVNTVEVLADWVYTPEEWKKFYVWEKSDRKLGTIVTAVIITILGGLLIRYSRQAGWREALLISGVVAVVYGLLSYRLGIASIGKAAASKPNQVIITSSAVLINDKLNPFINDDRWLKHVKILEEQEPRILEIGYGWNTRNGATSDELHIPIPKGKLGEAVRLMEKLNKLSR